jgi:D-glycero-D-manno-heptose 1,7-bisphosphate phosphatase
MRRAVFFDRDGVLVMSRSHPDAGAPPASIDDAIVAHDAAASVERLRPRFVLVVVTNQPDVARGTKTEAEVDAVNALVGRELGIEAMYSCLHDGRDCPCRKPRPGMLYEASDELGLDLAASWFVGDRWVDIAAGRAAGARTVLLDRAYSWEPTSAGAAPQGLEPDAVVSSLAASASVILEEVDG